MFASLSLLALLLLQAPTSRADSTQAIVTTITTYTVSTSYSTSQSLVAYPSTYENIETITTTDSSGASVTTTTDYGPVTTTIDYTSDVVATIPVTLYITTESTIGQSTILDATDNSASPTSPSVASTESLGITYASTATATITNSSPPSTILSISNPSSATTSHNGSPAFASGTSAPTAHSSSGMSVGAKAAIGTAAVVLIFFLAILFFWLDRLRRQRKAIREQYPDGQAPGDEAGIFGFFSPIVGRPYDKFETPEKDIKMDEKKPATTGNPSTIVVRELSQSELTPPTVDESQPYRRPIPRRHPITPHSPVSPVSPVPPVSPISSVSRASSSGRGHGQSDHRSIAPDNASDLSVDPFQKGFPRPLSRFPSHHATRRSSGNITALPGLSGPS